MSHYLSMSSWYSRLYNFLDLNDLLQYFNNESYIPVVIAQKLVLYIPNYQ